MQAKPEYFGKRAEKGWGMNFIFWLIFLGFILYVMGRSKKKTKQTSGQRNQRAYTAYGSANRSVNSHANGSAGGAAGRARGKDAKKLREEQENARAEQMLGYCSSDAPDARGITFRNLPPGTDELSVLIRANAQREKELERSMHQEAAEVEAEARASQAQ